jgi:RNA polymerase sigma-70 factor (ECF subfamily)
MSEPTNGDERVAADSFESFYESQYASVVRLAAALVGRWDVAEELVQDSFLELYRRWSRIASYDAPEAWLRRVVLNRATSALRRRAVEIRVSTLFRARRAATEELVASDGEIWRAVSRLPTRQAQAIALTFLEDRTVADVALILRCAESTVRTHLARGLHTLSEQLAATEGDR